MLPPDLPCPRRASRSSARHRAAVAAAPWPHPKVPASKRRALRRWSESPASPSRESARPLRSPRWSENRRPDAAPESASTWCPGLPLKVVHIPANANNGPSSSSANHTTSFFFVSGFGSSAHSAKLLPGTKQRLSGVSHMRQCGEVVVRMFVTGGPPVRGGGSMPQCIMVSSRPTLVFCHALARVCKMPPKSCKMKTPAGAAAAGAGG